MPKVVVKYVGLLPLLMIVYGAALLEDVVW